jgi:hypothetical protein
MADPPDRGYDDDALARVEEDDGLWPALGALPRKQRAILVLRYYESLSDAEIADVLGISRATVRSQASRCPGQAPRDLAAVHDERERPMTDELQDALRRTLADAAERAPKAPPGIGLEPRTRRAPRGYSRMALTAAAVALAIVGATVGGRTLLSGSQSSGSQSSGGREARQPATAPSPTLHRPKKTKVPPMEQVWPKAIHRVPRTLTDGRVFRPEAVIDDHTILISTESSFEKPDALYAYDLRNHATKQITTVVTPPATTVFATGFTVGSGYAAWWVAGDYGGEIWSAPIAGGGARLVSRVNTSAPSRIAIDGGDVVWSPERIGGIYRASVSGGPAQEMPGTRSMYILAWPWVGSPPPTQAVGEPSMGVTAFAHVTNVLTGETRSARLTDRAAWKCGLTWCVGHGPDFVTEAQRRDGSGRRAIPAQQPEWGLAPILDRFVVTFPVAGTIAVYDLRTGRSGDLRISHGKGAASYVMPRDPANRLYWTTTNGGYVIVDLGAI